MTRLRLKPSSTLRLALAIVVIALSGSRPAISQGVTSLSPPDAVIPASLFGIHIHRSITTTPWPAVPIAEWRLWDAYATWPNLEPRKGVWRFENVDKYIALAEQHGVGLIMPLALSPTWASARPAEKSAYQPGNAAEPANLDDWREYVRTVTTRYKGHVHYYEIWNEPNLKAFCTANVDQILTLTREASQIVHQVDPTAKVVSPSATSSAGLPWLSEFLSKGGGQYVDIIGFHLYVNPQPPEAMLPLIQQIRQIMDANGASAKPLWNTETNWFSPKPFPSRELAAGYVARSYILNWAAGVQRLYWFAWDNRFVQILTTEDDNATPTPAGRAYGTTYKWLVGARMDAFTQDASQAFVCRLNRKGALSWIVWNPVGIMNFDVPRSWHATSETPLLADTQSLSGTTVPIGPVPILLQ